ncbi:MAG: hypothetical protein U0736_26995 [Gemmataceae bacterium]
MTFIGKLFVMLNLALSLVLGTVAFGVYSGGLDFSSNPAKGSQPPGLLVAKLNDIKDLQAQQPVVEGSWRTARTELDTREDTRRDDSVWYGEELRKLKAGGNAEINVVVQEKGGAEPPAGRPRLARAEESAGNALRVAPYYVAQLETLRKENEEIRAQLETRVKEDTSLTNKLAGDLEKKLRGLREQLARERVKKAGIVEEQGILNGQRVNATVESELIFKRLETLDERIAELTRYLKRKYNVDATAPPR